MLLFLSISKDSQGPSALKNPEGIYSIYSLTKQSFDIWELMT